MIATARIIRPGDVPEIHAQDTLVLAEGVESIRYRFFTRSGDFLDLLPAGLNGLERCEVRVVVRSLYANRQAKGPAAARDTLKARIAYRRTF